MDQNDSASIGSPVRGYYETLCTLANMQHHLGGLLANGLPRNTHTSMNVKVFSPIGLIARLGETQALRKKLNGTMRRQSTES